MNRRGFPHWEEFQFRDDDGIQCVEYGNSECTITVWYDGHMRVYEPPYIFPLEAVYVGDRMDMLYMLARYGSAPLV
jgi:hypothetical protein